MPTSPSDNEDLMIYSISPSGTTVQKYAIFIRTLTADADYSATNAQGWGLSNLKC